jgi:hypothetical protein
LVLAIASMFDDVQPELIRVFLREPELTSCELHADFVPIAINSFDFDEPAIPLRISRYDVISWIVVRLFLGHPAVEFFER